MTKRQPKGTPVGGQFAEDKTPAGPDLTDNKTEAMLCAECGQSVGYDDSDTLQHLADGEWDFESDGDHSPSVSGTTDNFVSTVSDADKKRYADSITAMYEEFASMGLEADTSRYLPNERGFQLLADSSFKITGELETSNGIAWTAILRMNGKTISVENRGDGGSNSYSLEGGGGGWKLEAELNVLVTQGFPGLGSEAIDDFCSILEVAHEGDPK